MSRLAPVNRATVVLIVAALLVVLVMAVQQAARRLRPGRDRVAGPAAGVPGEISVRT
jgi:hypothetical protein